MLESAILKNIGTIVHTSAQIKGRRLRMSRALVGLSRQELYEKTGIATSTIDTWESGRVEVTEKSAERFCNAMKQLGVHCTIEWLLTGAGSPPRLMDDLEKTILVANGHDSGGMNMPGNCAHSLMRSIPPFLDGNFKKELRFFIGLHEHVMFHVVKEDCMNSRFRVGDCVAGIEHDVKDLVGCIVIISIEDDKTSICKLISCKNNECEVFFNVNRPREKLVIDRAAEIIWHRILAKNI